MTGPLAAHTTLGLGGPARRLVEAATEDALVAAVREADAAGEPLLLLGGGSNVVVPDEGFDGVAVLVRTRGLLVDGPVVEAAAGEVWEDVVAACVAEGLAGTECLAGIPGRVGATPVQNVGAYGQEVAQTVEVVRALDRTTGEVVELDREACRFAYRDSRFKQEPGRWVVLSVRSRHVPGGRSLPVRYAELARALGVEVGETVPLAEVPPAVVALRRRKGMVVEGGSGDVDPDTRSVGSFFTNPVLDADGWEALRARASARGDGEPPHWGEPGGRVKVSAAWLVQHAGFAPGYGPGPVRVSTKHALALTHPGGGSTRALLALAREVRDGVREAFGVEVVPEPVLVGGALDA